MTSTSLQTAMRTKEGLRMLIIRHAAGRCDAKALQHMVRALSFYEQAEDRLAGPEPGGPRVELDEAMSALSKANRSACFAVMHPDADEPRTLREIIQTLSVYVYGDLA